jgi:hypothetical protein
MKNHSGKETDGENSIHCWAVDRCCIGNEN